MLDLSFHLEFCFGKEPDVSLFMGVCNFKVQMWACANDMGLRRMLEESSRKKWTSYVNEGVFAHRFVGCETAYL